MPPMAGGEIEIICFSFSYNGAVITRGGTETCEHLFDFQFINRRHNLPCKMEKFHDCSGSNARIKSYLFGCCADEKASIVFRHEIRAWSSDGLFQTYLRRHSQTDHLSFYWPNRDRRSNSANFGRPCACRDRNT